MPVDRSRVPGELPPTTDPDASLNRRHVPHSSDSSLSIQAKWGSNREPGVYIHSDLGYPETTLDSKSAPNGSVPSIVICTNFDEKNGVTERQHDTSDSSEFYACYRLWIHVVIWLLLTAFFIAVLVLHSERYLVPTMLYMFVSGKLLFAHVPVSLISRPLGKAIGAVFTRPVQKIPPQVRFIIGVLTPLACYVLTVLVPPETEFSTRMQRAQSLAGLLIFIALLVLVSSHRTKINWRTILVGLLAQFLIGVFTLKTQVGYNIFNGLSQTTTKLLGFAKFGTEFLFGSDVANLPNFAVQVLPVVLFFASFIQMVYYLGGMQWFIRKFAIIMVNLMDTSGAESVVAASSFIVGQCESALLVKPFLEYMTVSELHSVMVSGFATISGAVLAGFISLGVDPQSLITACVMSMPSSLVVAKLCKPETEESLTKGEVKIPEEEDREANLLHAAANGAAQGLTLAGLIGATLLAITSLLALTNAVLTYFGELINIPDMTLQSITSYIFIPAAWCIGVPANETQVVGQLLATKMFASEFVAYADFTNEFKEAMSPRAQLLTTYALCGFANFASIGIQIGGIGAMTPTRKGDLAKVALSAMLCGTMSTLLTATIAGMLS
ncbi:hypothetical protein IWQ61_001263 [Dispira simplex]|nr:hypothetical protein IWQ61_001263 [Dispira simplex]